MISAHVHEGYCSKSVCVCVFVLTLEPAYTTCVQQIELS